MTKLREYTPPPTTNVVQATDQSFASRAIDLADVNERRYVHETSLLSQLTAKQAWEWYEKIGEVRYGISRSARIAGYAKLKAVRVKADGNVERDAKESEAAARIVEQIYSPYGGLRHLIDRFYHLSKLPAEMHLIRVKDGVDYNGYMLLSPDELITNDSDRPGRVAQEFRWRTAAITSTNPGQSNTQLERPIANEDYIGRIWNPSPRYVDLPDSPMSALATECEVLHMLTETMKSRLLSRFALAGILLIPSEMNDANIAGPQPTAVLHSDKVLNYIITSMTRGVMNHGSQLASIPIALKGPAEVLEKVRHLILDGAIAETDIKLRAELINRILTGLDVQKAATQGMENLNHFSAWAVSDEERRVTVQPDIESFCWSITRLILWRRMKEMGWDDARIRPWRISFDLSEASVKSNQAEDFRQAYDRGGTVNQAALRRVIGALDTDQMDAKEYVRWVGAKHGDPYLALYGLEGVDVDWDKVGLSRRQSGPTPASPADEAPAGPGVGEPGSPDDEDTDTPRTERPA